MALRKAQFAMNLATIYSLIKFDDNYDFATPRLFFKGGTVNIYASEELPASKAEMVLQHTNIGTIQSFETIPNYIYVEQNSGTVTSVIITGVNPTEV